MLIYAKRSFDVSPRLMARAIAREVASALALDQERVRRVLIACGQLEQGVADACDAAGELAPAADAAARLFVSCCRGEAAPDYGALSRALAAAADLSTTPVSVRVPEGFAWYALYPESYVEAATVWARSRKTEASVAVLGLRSIGTTLARVVAAALRAEGVRVATCLTVRTSGHPYRRRAALPHGFRPADFHIVVDEGPGASGSSMAAVAETLAEAGADPARVLFLPGHTNGPGHAASEAVRRWWRPERVIPRAAEPRVGGEPLNVALSRLAASFGNSAPVGPPLPFGTEAWLADTRLSRWPRALAPSLETPKRFQRLANGAGVLLRFSGLAVTGVDEARGLLVRATDSHRWQAHGWTAEPWIEGRRLTAADGDDNVIVHHLAPHIAASACETASARDIREGRMRIAAALEAWWEAGGSKRGVTIGPALDHARSHFPGGIQLQAGDGRLAPHKWVRTPLGATHKTDRVGHDRDHTWVGRQALAWDLAGAEIEWELPPHRAALLHAEVRRLTGYAVEPRDRLFYRAGYACFRAAAARTSAAACSGDMRAHLDAAAGWYEEQLVAALAGLASEATS